MAAPTAPKASLGARLRYRFDNALARGPVVVIAYMGLFVLGLIIIAGLLSFVFSLTYGDGISDSPIESMYQALLRMLDPGTFSGDATWSLRALTLVVTLIGVIIGGSLIGLIANAVDQRVEELNRGRGAVIESGHSLILGWSPQVPQIISELIIANESEKDAAVVVLAKTEKTEMEELIREAIDDTKSTRVVCRNGDPSMPADLERACVGSARSIIAVRDEEGDASVVKAILAVRSLDPAFAQCHVVAEITADDNARTIRTVTGGRVLTVSSDRVVAEVTAQACLQSGLAGVFADLLDFDGDEIYFTPAREVAGQTYAAAQLAYEASSIIGVVDAAGEVHMNPPADTVLTADDKLILVASDDSAVRFTGLRTVSVPDLGGAGPSTQGPIRLLVVGWSQFGALVLEQLDEFLVPGSTIVVSVDADLADPASVPGRLEHGTVTVETGAGGPEDIFALEGREFDQVIVLGYRDALSPADADARTLLSLLALRMMWPKESDEHVRIVAELVDQRNLAIATPVGIDDLIVSDALASLMMAQLSEHAALLAVFEDLFDPDGAVVSLLPATSLVPNEPVEYASVVAAASAQGASAFGIRRRDGEVMMNPAKSTRLTLGEGDQVIAVAARASLAPPPPPPPAKRASRTRK